jgi:hypothetical protein
MIEPTLAKLDLKSNNDSLKQLKKAPPKEEPKTTESKKSAKTVSAAE